MQSSHDTEGPAAAGLAANYVVRDWRPDDTPDTRRVALCSAPAEPPLDQTVPKMAHALRLTAVGFPVSLSGGIAHH